MGSLEADVLSTLWAVGKPMTPGEVGEAIDGDLAYTTIQTVLTRLSEKGMLQREPAGRTFRYHPLVSEGELAARKMRAALAGAQDRDDVLSHFAEDLTPAEAKKLRAFLDRGRKR
ncbi:MAG TPA: BlaI/MecI/CopY family transcriptional regulator [Mycobacterium sp.]|nr:BlaI/MecI/CopY family transcriptional regulator [Mycobacterium sp.]